jgi:hypothetical protein
LLALSTFAALFSSALLRTTISPKIMRRLWFRMLSLPSRSRSLSHALRNGICLARISACGKSGKNFHAWRFSIGANDWWLWLDASMGA